MPTLRLDPGGNSPPPTRESLHRIASALESIAGSMAIADRGVDGDKVYTRAEIARKLRCSTRTVDRLIGRGDLSVVRKGRSVSIKGDSVLKLRTHRGDGAPAKVLQI